MGFVVRGVQSGGGGWGGISTVGEGQQTAWN